MLPCIVLAFPGYQYLLITVTLGKLVSFVQKDITYYPMGNVCSKSTKNTLQFAYRSCPNVFIIDFEQKFSQELKRTDKVGLTSQSNEELI